jgi:hypothetical protein
MKAPRLLFTSLLALLVLCGTAVIIAFAVISSSDAENPGTSMVLFDIGVFIAYALLLAAFVLAVVFPVVKLVKDFKSSVRALIGIGAVLLVFGISFLFSAAATGDFYTTHQIGPQMARMINAGLITTYVCIIGSIVVFVYAEISRSIK